MSIGEIVELLLDPAGSPRDGVRVLGGEPFLQQENLPQQHKVADVLRELDESHMSQSGTHVDHLKASSATASGPETSIRLARLWAALGDVRSRIDNEVVPLGMHLGLEDPELMLALETISERIREHFGHWRLIAERRRNVTTVRNG